MASSRELDSLDESSVDEEDSLGGESVDDAELASESETTFEPAHLIALLISLHHATAEIILKFDMTSQATHWYVLIWLTENLPILSHPDNSRLLLLLENIMAVQDEKADSVIESVLKNLNALPLDKPIEERVLDRLLTATRNSNCKGEIRERRYYHAVASAGNHKLLSALQKNGFFASHASTQVGEMLIKSLERKDRRKSEDYLETLRLVTEYKLKTSLISVKNKIQTFEFVLHNNGGVMVNEIGHKVSTHAASVFHIVSAALEEKLILIDKCHEVVERVSKELSVSDSKENKDKGWFSTAWLTPGGVRDSSTTAFYKEILEILDDGIAALNNYLELAGKARPRL